ncbi:carbohydrate sulfotransferase 11 [Helicoverpa armigera]|uniref:carbohydrate sulfotransferase 11 n=1 Tax=Helicoverpa armigera TaxID=29058 RepID=UPI000B36AB28|nr:carbohydrate sulfotransferase 11 [Helicoverpa armigera]XP_047018795.1 carbohydrate sulfotransferase 11 isoform X1 [Helicoverpa zea]
MWKMGVLRVEIVLLLNLLLVSGDVTNNDVSEHSLELTQSLNLARQELIQETCRRFPPRYGLDELPPSQLEHILIDEEHKLLYCYVPKVACTNWKRILMILAGKWNDTDVLSITASIAHTPGMFRNLSTVSRPERDYMLENYHKMVIARNPFERLLSAYRNKLEGDLPSAKYFQDRVGRRIIKAYRENPSNESLEFGHDVTFKEFALFLTNRSEELADVVNNEHWQPITNLCHPCLIKYTLVGKYETLVDDSQLALHTINASHIQFPRLDHTSGTAEKLHRYFSQLDLPLIRRLYKLYKHDYRIFNYDLDNIVGFDLG